jgi:hypothetical protein
VDARDYKTPMQGLIGKAELKAIFGVFDVSRTKCMSLQQYKEGVLMHCSRNVSWFAMLLVPRAAYTTLAVNRGNEPCVVLAHQRSQPTRVVPWNINHISIVGLAARIYLIAIRCSRFFYLLLP